MNSIDPKIELSAQVSCPKSQVKVGAIVKFEAHYTISCINDTDQAASYQVLITIQVGEKVKWNKASVSLPPRGKICSQLGQEMKLEVTQDWSAGSTYEVVSTIMAYENDTGEITQAKDKCEIQIHSVDTKP